MNQSFPELDIYNSVIQLSLAYVGSLDSGKK